ncbi:MAG: hypothetical protein U9O94_06200 [Nanoarchaeota archaeon]|nr:hypothetical protein [Nanoarchaeota archaeon]
MISYIFGAFALGLYILILFLFVRSLFKAYTKFYNNFIGVGEDVMDFIALVNNGDIEKIKETYTFENGIPKVFENNQAECISCCKVDAHKIMIVYKIDKTGGYGTAVVGTISGTSISFGKPHIFVCGNMQHISCCQSDNNKVVIVYRDIDISLYIKTVVGNVIGKSITFGTPVMFRTLCTGEISCRQVSNNEVVITCQDVGNIRGGDTIACIVIGTSITYRLNR